VRTGGFNVFGDALAVFVVTDMCQEIDIAAQPG
jgi:hypothetical protein